MSADLSFQTILDVQKKKERLTKFAFGGPEESQSEKLQVSLITTLPQCFATHMVQELESILHMP